MSAETPDKWRDEDDLPHVSREDAIRIWRELYQASAYKEAVWRVLSRHYDKPPSFFDKSEDYDRAKRGRRGRR